MQKIVLLALAGAAGTLSRYWLSGAVHAVVGRLFPWGTMVVNTLGCLLFGLFFVLGEERFALRGETRTVVLVGFMGAFTTFSSLVFETDQYLREAQYGLAALNLAGECVLGFAALYVGMVLGRII